MTQSRAVGLAAARAVWDHLCAWPTHRKALLIFGLALMVRAMYAWLVGSTIATDSQEYLRIASEWLASGRLGEPVKPPLYPLLLGVMWWLVGRAALPGVMVALQVTLGAATCVLAYLAGRRIFGERIGLAAGLYLVVYYPVFDQDRYVMSESLYICLLALSVWLLSTGEGRGALASGVAMSLAALTRAVGLLTGAGIALAMLTPWGPDVPLRRRAGRAGLFALGMGLLLIANGARNRACYGHFVLSASSGAYNLFISSFETHMQERIASLEALNASTGEEAEQAAEYREPEYGGKLMRAWLGRWAADPLGQIALRLRSLGQFWSPAVLPGYWGGMSPGTLYRFGVYLLTLPTFLVGLWVIVRQRRPETYALLAIIFSAMGLYTFTHMEPRYRAPLEPYIIMISFYGLVALLERNPAYLNRADHPIMV
jgi:4-amino-4-deoxy-L-arabinose transferase-like glycosyltransferase